MFLLNIHVAIGIAVTNNVVFHPQNQSDIKLISQGVTVKDKRWENEKSSGWRWRDRNEKAVTQPSGWVRDDSLCYLCFGVERFQPLVRSCFIDHTAAFWGVNSLGAYFLGTPEGCSILRPLVCNTPSNTFRPLGLIPTSRLLFCFFFPPKCGIPYSQGSAGWNCPMLEVSELAWWRNSASVGALHS